MFLHTFLDGRGGGGLKQIELNPKPLHPRPETLNPETLNPKPQTLNPKP